MDQWAARNLVVVTLAELCSLLLNSMSPLTVWVCWPLLAPLVLTPDFQSHWPNASTMSIPVLTPLVIALQHRRDVWSRQLWRWQTGLARGFCGEKLLMHEEAGPRLG